MRRQALCRVERYGFAENSDWHIRNLRHEDGLTRWEVWHAGALWAELAMRMAGEHNALNATAAAALAFGQGVSKEAIVAALASFKSVKRRLEVRAEINGITIIDDFAHHPTAIRETLRALRSVYPQARFWAVLEPRSNTLRRKVLEAIWLRVCAWPTAWCWPGSISSSAFPTPSGCIRRMWCSALNAAGTQAELCPMWKPSSTTSRRNWNPAMWWRFFPMAASTASMRSCPRGSENDSQSMDNPMIPLLVLISAFVVIAVLAAVILILRVRITGNEGNENLFNWRLPVYAAVCTLIFFSPVMIYGGDSDILYIILMALLSIILILASFVLVFFKNWEAVVAIFSMLLANWLLSWCLLKNVHELHDQHNGIFIRMRFELN